MRYASNTRFLSVMCALAVLIFGQPYEVHSANSSFDSGVSLYQKGDFRGALTHFSAAQKAGLQTDNAMYYQALCWQKLGNMQNAKTVFFEVVRCYPASAAAQQSQIALNGLAPKVATAADDSSWITRRSGPTKLDPNDWYMGYKVRSEVGYADHREGMVINVLINGKSVPAIWDTGACGMHFDKSVLVSHGVDISKSHKAGRALGIGGEVQAYEFDAEVVVGRESCRIPVSYVDDDAAIRAGGARSNFGLIGEDFFGKYVYEVDPGSNMIRFLKRTTVDHLNPSTQSRQNAYRSMGEPFTWSDGLIIVRPKVNGRECDMILDTGATSIAFTDKQLLGAGMSCPVESRSGLSSGVGGTRESYIFNIGSIELGPASTHNVKASVLLHSNFLAPLLGQSFWKQLRYIVDPEHQIIRIGKG